MRPTQQDTSMTPEVPKPKPGDLLVWEQVNGNAIGVGLFLSASHPGREAFWSILWEDGEIRPASPDILWAPSKILREGQLIAIPNRSSRMGCSLVNPLWAVVK